MERVIPDLLELAAKMEGDLLMLCVCQCESRHCTVGLEADKVNKFLLELFPTSPNKKSEEDDMDRGPGYLSDPSPLPEVALYPTLPSPHPPPPALPLFKVLTPNRGFIFVQNSTTINVQKKFQDCMIK